MKCPKCEGWIQEIPIGYQCKDCHFKISRAKFEEVIGSLYQKKSSIGLIDNLAELNNLGHDPLPEGFGEIEVEESDEMFDRIGI